MLKDVYAILQSELYWFNKIARYFFS